MAEAQPEKEWTQPPLEIARDLEVDPDQGLAQDEVKRRQKEYGPNRLRRAETPTVWEILIALLLLAVYLPILSDVLSTVALDLTGWGLVLGFSLFPLLVGQIWLALSGESG